MWLVHPYPSNWPYPPLCYCLFTCFESLEMRLDHTMHASSMFHRFGKLLRVLDLIFKQLKYTLGMSVTTTKVGWPLTFDLCLLQVMERDSLNSIALKFDTTPSEIARLNKKPPGLSFSLFPGEVGLLHILLLPRTCVLQNNCTTHSTKNSLNHEDRFWFDDV